MDNEQYAGHFAASEYSSTTLIRKRKHEDSEEEEQLLKMLNKLEAQEEVAKSLARANAYQEALSKRMKREDREFKEMYGEMPASELLARISRAKAIKEMKEMRQ
jgi:hypothetical protein